MSDEERDVHGHQNVYIRSPSKIVFLYPTLLAALVAGIWTMILLGQEGASLDTISLAPGRIFCWVFAVNLLVLSFDFNRGEFVALVLFFAVVALGIILLNQEWAFVKPTAALLGGIKLQAHPHFYFLIALMLGLLFLGVFLYTRFDYWEVTHNELLHHHGIMGDVERYPAPDLRMTKEIADVFEYVLLGSGRLVLHPRGAARATVLENVPFVNRKEAHIQQMLSTLSVTMTGPPRASQPQPVAAPAPAAEEHED